MNRLSAFCALLVLSGCHRHDPRDAAESCNLIENDVRHGRISKAIQEARQAERRWSDRPESDQYVRLLTLESKALIESGDPRKALQLLQSLRPRAAVLQAQVQIEMGNALLKQDRYRESVGALDRGIMLAESPDSVVEGLIWKGSALLRMDDAAAAERCWREGLEKAEASGDNNRAGRILNNLATIQLNQGRYDAAVPFLERARARLDQASLPLVASTVLSNLALCYQQLGDLDRAFQMLRQVITVQEAAGARARLVYSYGRLGVLYYAQRDYPKAIAYYTRAFKLAEEQQLRSVSEPWAGNLVRTYLQVQDWPNAEFYNRRAGDDLYAKAAIAAGRGHKEEAITLYQAAATSPKATAAMKWDAYAALAQLYATNGDKSRSTEYFEKALAEVTEARAGLSKTDEKITFLSEPITVYQQYVDALIAGGESDKAMLVADESRGQVLMGQTGRADLKQLRAAAASGNAVLLSFWLTPHRSYAWVVTDKQVRIVPLPENEDRIRELVRAYRDEIRSSLRDPIENSSSSGRALSTAVLLPVLKLIPPGSNVIVVPDGPLHNMNLELLPVDSRYWIEQVTLSVAPSLSVLASRRQKALNRRGEVLIVGDPEPVAEYSRLPFAKTEIAEMENRFPTRAKTVLKEDQATVDAYRQAHPERFALIHFATHAEANSETPLDSAVILSPKGDSFKLYARDISAPLEADLVTISACESAGAKAYSGEGLIGFAWAFLHAGARNVVAGLWNVVDGPTAQMMDRMYAGIEAGESPAQALRDAKLELLHSGGSFRKPSYWGPFQVYRQSVR